MRIQRIFLSFPSCFLNTSQLEVACDIDLLIKTRVLSSVILSFLRYDWYQTEQQIVITVLIKNLKKEEVRVEFGEKTVTNELFPSEVFIRKFLAWCFILKLFDISAKCHCKITKWK